MSDCDEPNQMLFTEIALHGFKSLKNQPFTQDENFDLVFPDLRGCFDTIIEIVGESIFQQVF